MVHGCSLRDHSCSAGPTQTRTHAQASRRAGLGARGIYGGQAGWTAGAASLVACPVVVAVIASPAAMAM